MIGGPSDVVVEANIVRAGAPARDAAPQRPEALPRAVPMTKAICGRCSPNPRPPLFPRRASRARPAIEESMQWQEPEPMSAAARAGAVAAPNAPAGPRCARSRAPRCVPSHVRMRPSHA